MSPERAARPGGSLVAKKALATMSPEITAARLLTADQVAARWQVPKSQVYRLARESRLPAVKVGRYYRFRVDALEAWEIKSEAVGC